MNPAPSTSSNTANAIATQDSDNAPSGKRRSYVWTYFIKTGDKKARCDVCGNKVLTAGNTTNMIKV